MPSGWKKGQARVRTNYDNLPEELIHFPGIGLPTSLADKLIKLQFQLGHSTRTGVIRQALEEFVKNHNEKGGINEDNI